MVASSGGSISLRAGRSRSPLVARSRLRTARFDPRQVRRLAMAKRVPRPSGQRSLHQWCAQTRPSRIGCSSRSARGHGCTRARGAVQFFVTRRSSIEKGRKSLHRHRALRGREDFDADPSPFPSAGGGTESSERSSSSLGGECPKTRHSRSGRNEMAAVRGLDRAPAPRERAAPGAERRTGRLVSANGTDGRPGGRRPPIAFRERSS